MKNGKHILIRFFSVLMYLMIILIASQTPARAELQFVDFYQDAVGLNGAYSVTMSPDGSHVYAAAYWGDSLAVFSRDSVTGALIFVETKQDGAAGVNGLAGARCVTVSPDGDHVYAVGEDDDAVAVFSRNSTTGALTFVEIKQDGAGGVDGLNGASSVVVSPDGNHVYAAGYYDDAIAVFSRNSTTGALTFVEMKQDGSGGVDGLNGASSVVVSPDGNHVYAVGELDDAIAVFSRNSTTGALTFVEMKTNDLTIGGLDGASSVVVSPDGNHVYAAGYYDDAIAVFSRNNTSGALTFVEMKKDGVGDVADGLDGARSVIVSPDGKYVYAAGELDDAIAVFSRDSTTGVLTFVEMKTNDSVVNGLDGACSVTVSPNNQHVYVAGSNDDAIAFFSLKADEDDDDGSGDGGTESGGGCFIGSVTD